MRHLFLAIAVLAFGCSQAQALRFGPRIGTYKEAINTPTYQSRELGLQAGFYWEKSSNKEEIVRNSAAYGGCCGMNHQYTTRRYLPAAAPMLAQPAIMPQPQIYLLVLPESSLGRVNSAPARNFIEPPQDFNYESGSTVRGYW